MNQLLSTAMLLTFMFFYINTLPAQGLCTLDDVLNGFVSVKKRFSEEIPEFSLTCVTHSIEQITPSDSGQRLRAEWITTRKENMWKTDARLLDRLKRDDGTFFPTTPDIILVKQGAAAVYTNYNDLCVVYPLYECSDFFQNWGYFVRIGLNIFEEICRSNDVDYNNMRKRASKGSPFEALGSSFMPEYLKQNIQHYKIAETTEQIDGNICCIIEWPGNDKMWIDPQYGYVIRKRILYYQRDNARQVEILNRDYKEIKSGLWIPMTQIETLYADTSYQPQHLWDKALQRITYKISLSIDNVQQEVFDFTPPIGTRVTDGIRKENYTISDPNSAPFAGAIAQGIKASRFHMIRALLVIAGSVLVLLGVWFKFKEWDKRNAKQHRNSDEKS